jgi:hypothetical protein
MNKQPDRIDPVRLFLLLFHPHNFHTGFSQLHNTPEIRCIQVGGIPAKNTKWR